MAPQICPVPAISRASNALDDGNRPDQHHAAHPGRLQACQA